jgi:hypothetical protein
MFDIEVISVKFAALVALAVNILLQLKTIIIDQAKRETSVATKEQSYLLRVIF